jgi:hypothetical protein
MRKTNPIRPRVGGARSRADERCETNPIHRPPAWLWRADCAKRSQFPPVAGGTGLGGAWDTPQMCQTKPNLGWIGCLGKGRYCMTGPSPESGMRKTNPIARSGAPGRCPADGIPPPFQYSITPAFQSDANCAKRTQFPAGPGGTGSGERRAEAVVRNKANFHRVLGMIRASA